MTTDTISKLITSLILLLANSFLVMVLWNGLVAPELGVAEVSYLVSIALLLIVRLCAPPRFDD